MNRVPVPRDEEAQAFAMSYESGSDGSSDGGEAPGSAKKRGRWVLVAAILVILGVAAFFTFRAVVDKSNADDVEEQTPVTPTPVYTMPTSSASPPPASEGIVVMSSPPPVAASTVTMPGTLNPGTLSPYQQHRRKKPTLLPDEVPNDNNECDSKTEEEYGGLCYDKCSILTNGSYPYRSNAFACCEVQSCATNIMKMKVASILPCEKGSFDVAGDGSSCPHPLGACLADEDTFLGACYEKCAKLTNGTAPDRVGPASCCKGTGTKCLNPFNLETDLSYDVGGGKGDGDKSTPGVVHEPMKSLTETGS